MAFRQRGRGWSIGRSGATLVVASGFLFSSLYGGFTGGVNALLLGSFLGISAGQVHLLLAVAVAAVPALSVIARPLLFASIDPEVARARGVPVRVLSIAFLAPLAAAAAGDQPCADRSPWL